jgi:hypothetical protein
MAMAPIIPTNTTGISSGKIWFILKTPKGWKGTTILNDANASAESFEFTLTII